MLCIYAVRKLRTLVLLKIIRGWERQYGEKYFRDPLDVAEIENFYEDNNMKNPDKDIPKMTSFRKLILKLFNMTYAFEIGTFGSVMQDLLLWAGYDIFNYKSRINSYSMVGMLNFWISISVFFFVAWELTK